MAEYTFFDQQPPAADVRSEVLAGLRAADKTVSPKYFYDHDGSKLFEAITRLPEYYLTRTEMGIFDANAEAISAALAHHDCIIEYGSGSNMKIQRLLDIVRPRAYVPVDISSAHLQENARALYALYPQMSVYPVCADFTQAIPLPPPVQALKRTGFFPGSSLGNFEPDDAQNFLSNVAATVGAGGQLLIGVDCTKAPSVLEPAYDDEAGVTAQFNLNVLSHLNEELEADFDLAGFRHEAVYNEARCRIEMNLISVRDQAVTVAGETVHFAEGERIRTEHSYKYAPERFLELASGAGFEARHTWQDERGWFAVYLLEAR